MLEKTCPYCKERIQPDNRFCNHCHMDLSIFKTNPMNELVKVCPSCSREYSFETKVCTFCCRYLDKKVSPSEQIKTKKINVEEILNTFVIPGSGSLLTDKKGQAILSMIIYFLWVAFALYLVMNVSLIFSVIAVPVELFIRTKKLFK